MTGRRPRSRAIAVLLACGLVTGTLSATAAPASAEPERPRWGLGPLKAPRSADKLGGKDRQLLAEAEATGERTVTVMLATKERRTAGVAASIGRLGGTVGHRNDRIGYVRATLPTDAVTKTAGLADVLAVDLNETLPLPDPRPDPRPDGGAAGRASAAQGDGPGADTPDDNPFLPTSETGAVEFKRQHSTYDGRGITIGILDTGVDLDHPALQETTTGDRKIVDWVTATDPLLDGDQTWRPMLTQVSGPSFTVSGQRYTAPEGTFHVNFFHESATVGGELGGDVNRDGDTNDRWGILYRASDGAIWVDVDQDGDFTDEELMRPYRERFQVGHFGTDDPATAVREQLPFVVEYRRAVDLTPAGLPGRTADFVNIGIVSGAHGSHVAGITAANSMFGGEMDGAAPGANLVSSRACLFAAGCTSVALFEGMEDLVARRGVDVVNMSIGGLPALNDGNNARAELYNRLIDAYGVQLFLSAGNSGPGLNTVGDPSVATDAVSVGAAVSRETWQANYGAAVSAESHLFNFSARGPREDGGIKPNVTAPGSAVSTIPVWLPGSAVAQAGYFLPPGYAMFNGTSMAAPQAAGAAALLLSAGRQQGLPITPAQLRKAIHGTADFVPAVPAYAQGAGHVDTVDAWRLLRRHPVVRHYEVTGPVCTEISEFLATPGAGTGIYNRCAAAGGGQRPGESKTYELTVTRTSGPRGTQDHTIRWIGNDGTFRSASSVSLALNEATTLEVEATPSAGAHGAILQLDDPSTAGVDHMVLNTVVAPRALSAPTYARGSSGVVERSRTKSMFVTVPDGTAALQVDLTGIATGSQTRFIAFNPYGVPVESTSSLACFTNLSDPNACNPTSRAYENPIPGVWEIEVESRRTSPFLSNPYRLTAAAQGVSVEPEQVVLAEVTAGEPTPVTWSVVNRFGPVTVGADGGPLGSARSERPTIADGDTQTYEVEVPDGVSRLDVTVGHVSDPSADLDLYVYDEAGRLVALDADGDSEESVSLASPPAGTYTVEVDAFAVPAGTTDYDYLDVFFSRALGSITAPGRERELRRGGSTSVTGTLTAEAGPAEGRQLLGEMAVVSSTGAILGRGSVLVQSVGG